MVAESICGIDFKACKGCSDDCDMDEFTDRNGYETNYCPECRRKCPVCGDFVGACGGEHEEAA